MPTAKELISIYLDPRRSKSLVAAAPRTVKEHKLFSTFKTTGMREHENTMENLKPKTVLGFRHVQALLLFSSLSLASSMRVNISMAIVAMTDTDNENTFDWSMQTQSVILSSFFWGYIILQIPAGELASRFGGKTLLVSSIGINSAVSLVTPICAFNGGWQLVCACRVIQGLSQGVLFPTIHSLIVKWVPLEEKARLGTFIYAGTLFGNAFQFLSAGFIADYWGWPAIFYVIGTVGAIWIVIYAYLGASSPQEATIISDLERLYIETSLGHGVRREKLKTPWKSLLTSMPFISLIIVHCGTSYGFWALLTEIPSYMKQVHNLDIKANGMMSALPYLTMFILSFPFGFISDYVTTKKWLSVTAARKTFNSIGLYGAAIALIGLSYTPANVSIVVPILTVAVGISVGSITGFMTDASEWRIVFYIAAAIYVVTNTVFLVFGTSERQKWNDPENDEKYDQNI